ncbi:MAG TPA: NAD(P)H-binding protein [Candidatus Nanoarchaeia archaeon]|nr:NAD(P)H-binding protein [Candidatus Nanoarchaeia archaeon]
MSNKSKHKIFVSGSTGYIGTHLIPKLLENGNEVVALVRKGSENKVDKRAKIVFGNALDSISIKGCLGNCDTFVQLIGTSHPSPLKARQFNDVDLKSVCESLKAIKNSKIRHYIYMSVAHPAPVMKSYWQIRAKAEELIKNSKMKATILRPWYVLGPGHYWPYLILPFYKIAEIIPATRETAKRLSPVKLSQMVDALAYAAENPPENVKIIQVFEIKKY